VPAERREAVLADFKLDRMETLLEDIGLGKRLAPLVARHLLPPGEEDSTRASELVRSAPLAIKGTEGMVVSFPRCCYPIPGDPIMGYVSAGRGLVIHRQSCKNLAGYRNHPEKWVDIEWGADVAGEFPAAMRLEVDNQRGALATIAAAIAEQDANIEFVGMEERDDQYVGLNLTVMVRDRLHLARIMRALRRLAPVTRVGRLRA
jgi:(p)ppGpp synthase/HD superfamily hydrolase